MNVFAPPLPPELEDHELATRRAHVTSMLGSAPRRMRRVAFGMAFAAVLAVGTAFTLVSDIDETLLDRWERTDDSNFPRRVGDRVRIYADGERAVYAWKSTRGVCIAILAPGDRGASGCGFPVVGAPPDLVHRQPPPTHVIAGMFSSTEEDGRLDVTGAIAASVARVELELHDGRRIEAPVYEAPDELDLGVKLFYVRVEIDPPPRTGASPPEAARAFRAYSASRVLLERFVFPQR